MKLKSIWLGGLLVLVAFLFAVPTAFADNTTGNCSTGSDGGRRLRHRRLGSGSSTGGDGTGILGQGTGGGAGAPAPVAALVAPALPALRGCRRRPDAQHRNDRPGADQRAAGGPARSPRSERFRHFRRRRLDRWHATGGEGGAGGTTAAVVDASSNSSTGSADACNKGGSCTALRRTAAARPPARRPTPLRRVQQLDGRRWRRVQRTSTGGATSTGSVNSGGNDANGGNTGQNDTGTAIGGDAVKSTTTTTSRMRTVAPPAATGPRPLRLRPWR